MTNTQAQGAVRSAKSGYGGPVTPDEPSEHERTALEAIGKMSDLDVQYDGLRAARDKAVAAMHTADGLRPPEIARRTGMSVSNVRLAIDRHTR